MKKWLKDHFTAHIGNDHHPRILSSHVVTMLLAIVLITETLFLIFSFLILPNSNFFASILPDVLVDLTNKGRNEDSLATLSTNSVLEYAAQQKANDMASKGYFSHVSPDGKTPWYWLEKTGYRYSYAGENLAVNFVDSIDAYNAWMNSPSHRENILNKNFKEIGIASATGTYKGQEAIFIVQYFGTPVEKKTSIISLDTNSASAKETSELTLVTPEATQSYSPTVEPEPSVLAYDYKIPSKESQIINKAVTSPRHTTKMIFLLILGIISIAMMLTLISKELNDKHAYAVLHGVLVIVVIVATIIANSVLSGINPGLI